MKSSSTIDVNANVKLQSNLTIPVMQTRKILGVINIPNHVRRINVSTEAVPGYIEK